MLNLKTIIIAALIPVAAMSQDWSIEYHRGLKPKQSGELSVSLYGDKVFSHAFLPISTPYRKSIPRSAMVEAIIVISEDAGSIWGSDPMGEMGGVIIPASIGLILHDSWYGVNGRWYSTQRITIKPGAHRLLVPVDKYAWTNVYTKTGVATAQTKRAFNDSWTSPTRIGVCAGGNFYGHGIEMLAGSGSITVKCLRIIK
ncbi:MAG: hypothetical protein ABIR91_03685 [Candidatus Saccharimonadales bacterium]